MKKFKEELMKHHDEIKFDERDYHDFTEAQLNEFNAALTKIL